MLKLDAFLTIRFEIFAKVYLVSCFFIPLISSIPFKLPVKLPALIIADSMIIIFFIDIILKKRFPKELSWLLTLIIFSVIGMLFNFRYGFIEGLAIALKSRVIFIFLVTLFFYLYTFSKFDIERLKSLYLFIKRVVKLNMCIIICEGVLINSFDLMDRIHDLLGIGGYKVVSNVIFFNKIPNGLIFGPQNASLLSIIGIIIWFPWNNVRKIDLRQFLWFGASCLAWLFTINMTSILCVATVLVFSSIILLKQRNLFYFTFVAIILTLLISFYNIIIEKKYTREINFSSDKFVVEYIDIFIHPIIPFIENPFDALRGTGNLPQDFAQEPLLKKDTLVNELGFLVLSASYGGLLIGSVLLYYFIYFLIYIKSNLRAHYTIDDVSLRLVSVTLGIMVSGVHYSTLINPGIMQLFAFSAAIAFAIERLRWHEFLNTLRK